MLGEVRIVRLIEIIYPSLEDFERDSSRWYMPMQGTKIVGNKVYRCATINPTSLFNEVPENKGLLPGDPGYVSPPTQETVQGGHDG